MYDQLQQEFGKYLDSLDVLGDRKLGIRLKRGAPAGTIIALCRRIKALSPSRTPEPKETWPAVRCSDCVYFLDRLCRNGFSRWAGERVSYHRRRCEAFRGVVSPFRRRS